LSHWTRHVSYCLLNTVFDTLIVFKRT